MNNWTTKDIAKACNTIIAFHRQKRSRNQREGRYAGKHQRKHHRTRQEVPHGLACPGWLVLAVELRTKHAKLWRDYMCTEDELNWILSGGTAGLE